MTAHQHPLNFHGWVGEGYIIIDPETGGGAYKISGGGNGGLLVATGYILNTLELFYGVLSALAATLGPMIPLLNKVVQYIEIARFVHVLLRAGLECSHSLDAIIFVTTLGAMLSFLIAEIALMLWNPLAAFAAGFVVDRAFSVLMTVSEPCG